MHWSPSGAFPIPVSDAQSHHDAEPRHSQKLPSLAFGCCRMGAGASVRGCVVLVDVAHQHRGLAL